MGPPRFFAILFHKKHSPPPAWLGGWGLGWWVAGWLVGWLVGWLAGWLVGWLAGSLKKYVIDFDYVIGNTC